MVCPADQLSSLYNVAQDFFKVCLADEGMFAVIALVYKKWSLFINEKFGLVKHVQLHRSSWRKYQHI